ncbi:MAG TPA: VOC family protein [Candidatus Dormibacteraeota bacterium]|nr:VOC family protein [Candidatus Dormibacteraeota bacterium]
MTGGLLPVDRFHHLTVVVRDLETSARSYAALLGVERWEVARFTPDRLGETTAFGYEAAYTYTVATGSTPSGVTFQLVQPTGGLSTFAEFLVTRGEGVHGLCLSVVDEAAWERVAAGLEEAGVGVGQAATVDGVARHYHLDTRRALGGFYLEVVVPLDPGSAPRVDEWWDLAGVVEPPPGAEPLRDEVRVWHLGVVVSDLMGRLPAYARILGLSEWSFLHFRHEPGSLQRSTLDGEEVEPAFLLATAGLPDLAFEVIQPTVEPTHYRRAFLDRIGEGIHHLLVLPALSEARWQRLRAAMEAAGAPVAMSGSVRSGSAEFFYLDTRSRLGGFLLEAICRRDRPDVRSQPDFRFDFSRPAGGGHRAGRREG